MFSAEEFIVADAEARRALRVGLTGMEHVDELEKGLRILLDIVQNSDSQDVLHTKSDWLAM